MASLYHRGSLCCWVILTNCPEVAHLDAVGRHCPSFVIDVCRCHSWLHYLPFVLKKEWGRAMPHLNWCGQWQQHVSSLSGQCGTSVDVPCHLECTPLKQCALIGWRHGVVNVLGCPWSNDGHRWLVVVEVTLVGGCWQWRWHRGRDHDNVGGWEAKGLFSDDVYVLFLANTTYATQYKDTTVAYMIYYLIAYKFLSHHCALIYKKDH